MALDPRGRPGPCQLILGANLRDSSNYVWDNYLYVTLLSKQESHAAPDTSSSTMANQASIHTSIS